MRAAMCTVLSFVFLAALICGCGSQPTAPPKLGAVSAYAVQQDGTLPATVLDFSLGGAENEPPSVLSLPPHTGVTAIATDDQGHLYVATSAGKVTVMVYPAGANTLESPSRTIVLPQGTVGIVSLAVDGSGSVYTLTQSGFAQFTIFVYAPGANGNATPRQTIISSQPNLGTPGEMAVDAAGNIYVDVQLYSVVNDQLLSSNGVLVYPAGSNGTVAAARVLTNPEGLTGVAADAQGDLYCMQGSGTQTATILEFAPGASGAATPTKSVTVQGLGGYYGLGYLQVDTVGNIYFLANEAANITSQTTPHLVVISAATTGKAKPILDLSSPDWTFANFSIAIH